MNGLLIRVGIDQTFGKWNSLVDPKSEDFVYVPIPEDEEVHPKLETKYHNIIPHIETFYNRNNINIENRIIFPENLINYNMHPDPDFRYLTYGDQGNKGAMIRKLKHGDLLVFYAGLAPVTSDENKLIYAIIGIYIIDKIVPASSIPEKFWHENAHTRRKYYVSNDIVVKAQKKVSGRLKKCISIGEWRNRAYRVRNDILEKWGGLSVKDGFIQRSAVPPSFSNPKCFYSWLLSENIELIQQNNLI